MGKPPKIPDMPPLTLEMHGKLRLLESTFMRALSSCCNAHELTDPDAAVEYARTYAIEFYDCFYGFYSQIPGEKYRRHWQSGCERAAFDRAAKCLENTYLIRAFFSADRERIDRIIRTISSHARSKPRHGGVPTPAKMGSTSSVAEQLCALLDEARATPEDIAEYVMIEPRSVYRHMSGENYPRKRQIAAYEKYFSKRLNRTVRFGSSE